LKQLLSKLLAAGAFLAYFYKLEIES